MAIVYPYLTKKVYETREDECVIKPSQSIFDSDLNFEAEDFTDRSDDRSQECPAVQVKQPSYFVPKYVYYRQAGHFKRIKKHPMAGLHRMLRGNMLVEQTYSIEPLDKVFCSDWLNSRQVIFGTKCNRLMLLDTKTKYLMELQNLYSSAATKPPLDDICGIHAIAVNPSRTRLVTGARNPNDTAVFSLPSLDPICVGEGGHNDWIFDIKWLDDQHYVSGGRDSLIILWDVNDKYKIDVSETGYIRGRRNEDLPRYFNMNPVKEICSFGHKVRAMAFEPKTSVLSALTLSARVQLWDMKTQQMTMDKALEYDQENVCIAVKDNMTVVGSKSYVTILDSRSLGTIRTISALKSICGVRSLSFKDYLLTVGTGQSNVLFLDTRNFQYIEIDPELQTPKRAKTLPEPPLTMRSRAYLQCSPGWMSPSDNNFADDYNPAVYTHCYDPTGLKLFTAGGPLPASSRGGYAALWQ
ncbi:DDB1- and CUL4-associated factor 12 [Galendromus occidentalis]|uniref:DDB1- and CUL4-associated factor 12 n=1 Tax=Galendromus occidentalis TaxID=34638 RepID=A0AAJ7PAS5_9ACAR|nr:DDB1- and CUL4-associated factor 12 [Galendromus occidentalis]